MSRDGYVIGSIRPSDGTKIALRCGWCREWQTEEDRVRHENGAPISHGICETCARKHFPDSETKQAAPEGATPEGLTGRDAGDWPPPAA